MKVYTSVITNITTKWNYYWVKIEIKQPKKIAANPSNTFAISRRLPHDNNDKNANYNIMNTPRYYKKYVELYAIYFLLIVVLY